MITVDGELDHHTAPQLRAALDEVAFGPGSLLVIDLTRLTYCDSTGITAMVTAHQRAQRAGGLLTLAGLSQELRRVFEIVGLDQFFSIRPTVADAIETAPGRGTAPEAP
ncbi:STAS domain-containing protein [Streptacidiphilus sp. PB12-B1b]|nr:STAS domain-containing protein [Streptacidiphilus sp. PB12-B1b]